MSVVKTTYIIAEDGFALGIEDQIIEELSIISVHHAEEEAFYVVEDQFGVTPFLEKREYVLVIISRKSK